ncbi:MAG: hypothetical protein O7H39_07795 [Gammaproteobacteria bacterium]|nr:hypothetical protein [Gammaproteobacteria bacterium]
MRHFRDRKANRKDNRRGNSKHQTGITLIQKMLLIGLLGLALTFAASMWLSVDDNAAPADSPSISGSMEH